MMSQACVCVYTRSINCSAVSGGEGCEAQRGRNAVIEQQNLI